MIAHGDLRGDGHRFLQLRPPSTALVNTILSPSSTARKHASRTSERITAEHGFAGLTVQAVQRESGQRNKSAVQYHFNGRDGLIAALVADRIAPTEARRTSMLLALGEDASTRGLVEALVVPLVEAVLERQPSYWARFLIQALNDPTTSLAALPTVDSHAMNATRARSGDRLTYLSPATCVLRVQSAIGYTVVVLAAYEVGTLAHLAGEALTAEIVDACCGLVTATSSR